MRQVAVALSIDLNTVQRAYAELERQGVLTTVRGRGSFVADTPRPPRKKRKDTQDFAFKVAAEARAQGIDLNDLAAALFELAKDAP
jgi:GntR family transcriptional regulator